MFSWAPKSVADDHLFLIHRCLAFTRGPIALSMIDIIMNAKKQKIFSDPELISQPTIDQFEDHFEENFSDRAPSLPSISDDDDLDDDFI